MNITASLRVPYRALSEIKNPAMNRIRSADSRSSRIDSLGNKLLVMLRRSMTRDELFAGVSILACVNGLWGRVIIAVREAGWWGAVFTVDISSIVLVACFGGVWLILGDKKGKIGKADLAVTIFITILIILPIPALSWFALNLMSLYIIALGSSSASQKRGAVLMLAVTISMLWVPLAFRLCARFVLELDAVAVAWLIGSDRIGNLVAFNVGPGHILIAPGCSSITNVSLAFLCWVSVMQFCNHRWSGGDMFWGALVCSSAAAVNITRLALMAKSDAYFEVVHDQYWSLTSTVGNVLTMVLVVGVSLIGARRKIFLHA